MPFSASPIEEKNVYALKFDQSDQVAPSLCNMKLKTSNSHHFRKKTPRTGPAISMWLNLRVVVKFTVFAQK